MSKADEFSKPLSQRSCPEGVAPEVWQAFVHYSEAGTPDQQKPGGWPT